MTKMTSALVLALFSAMLGSDVGAATTFTPPEQLTDSSEIFQLSRNPNASMGFDSTGRLHIVYWSGFFATNPNEPAYVYYQNWTEVDGWSTREFIDDSYFDDGSTLLKYGGRHPSLAIAPDDSVWVAWHDHRHSNPDPPGNGIDNIEIYADRRPAGGSFSSTDIRLTQTSAAHFGDNGYMARIVAAPDGTISVLWYDFHEDGNISDIFVTSSDTTGDFGAIEPILSMRITDQDDRPGSGFSKEAYSIPDLAVDQSGDLYAIWTSGFGGAAPVYFAEVPNPVTTLPLSSIETAASSTGAYFDPAKVTVAPTGDVWLAYTGVSGTERDIYAMRRPAGSSSFDNPILLKGAAGVLEKAVDLEVDATGLIHFAWIDNRSGTHVYYGVYDPIADQLDEEVQVTEDSLAYERVTLALDETENVFLLFDSSSVSSGDVWFARSQSASSVRNWSLY